MAVIATGISWRPSERCNGYMARLRTFKLAVIATEVGFGHKFGCDSNRGRLATNRVV